ncbi:MAG: acyl-CoA synthetase FdrA [Chloroflexi bacterium]|nr:acyl-CoA synthetase FdrA [Chloroflexota bacterium]
MPIRTLIKPSQYHDSVSLMLVARQLAALPGVADAAVIMATEANKGILKEAGLLTAEAEAATSNDLVIAVNAAEDLLEGALAEAGQLLQARQAQGDSGEFRSKTVRGALKTHPEANVAVISVAGRYAAGEAWEALHHGLHVLLFSDNVSLEDEIALKRYASDHGLLLMGPGAGTAILNGVALGFANVIPAGVVGIVSAAGTGLQEVSTLLAKHGAGITQGIGVGGRDLKEEVGGTMMLAGLRALQEDPATQVIVLISKPPAPGVAQKILAQAALSRKPGVVCFLGGEFAGLPAGLHAARTLEEAALLAAELAGVASARQAQTSVPLEAQAAALRSRLTPGQRYLRGLFSGGTLCYEAQVIWRELLNAPVYSNAPLDKSLQLPDSNRSQGHTAVDLGEEEFTVGRLHPMIDNDLRIRRLLHEARDPQTALILLDVVLGYGAHPDPAAELGAAVRTARAQAAAEGRQLIVVASVTGSEQDPQRLSRQAQALEDSGVILCPSNAAAARLAAAIVSEAL